MKSNADAKNRGTGYAWCRLLALPVVLCGLASHATQYVVPGGAGDLTGGSWANARADVQSAVDAAALPGEEVWVAEGRYELAAPVALRSGSVVLGGFAGTESAAGQRDWDANVTVLDGLSVTQVVRMVNLTSARFDGLVVTRGYVTVPNKMGGGGILMQNCTSCLVTRCKILYNSSVRAPGAGSCEGGGIFLTNTLDCVVEDCLFTGNYANPAGTSISLMGSPGAVIKECRFAGDWQPTATGVIRVNDNGPKYLNCVFSGNGVNYGSFLYGSQSQTAVNCTACFTTNGINGAFSAYSSLILRNSILAYNGGVAVYEQAGSADPYADNNLFYGQTRADYYDADTLSYLTGAGAINTNTSPDRASGNVDGDPRFVRCPAQDDGAWTAVGAYDQDRTQTTLTDAGASYRPGALKGRFLNPDTAETLYRHAEIADNTATSITVWGKADWAGAGTGYRIYDYRLRRDSPALNAGLATGAPDTDVDGNPRSALGGIDIGAYEVQPQPGTTIMVY